MPDGSPPGGLEDEQRSLRSEIERDPTWIAPTASRSEPARSVSPAPCNEQSFSKRIGYRASTSYTHKISKSRPSTLSVPQVGTGTLRSPGISGIERTGTELGMTVQPDKPKDDPLSVHTLDEHFKDVTIEEGANPEGDKTAVTPNAPIEGEHEFLPMLSDLLPRRWKQVQEILPEAWQWDIEYNSLHADKGDRYGCWTCTPCETDEPKSYPLTIACAPVVLPVEHRWPPLSGLMPPPDPRPAAPIDCRAPIPLEVVRDIFLTFNGSIGFYILINGLLQMIVPMEFDPAWASSHLPHKYGGLKVCYIEQTLEPTMLSGPTRFKKAQIPPVTSGTNASSVLQPTRAPILSLQPVVDSRSLRLNDSIEARPLSNYRRERSAGRIGLKVVKEGNPFIVMPTHVITEAIVAKSMRDSVFGRSRSERIQKLRRDWNTYTDIWAGNQRIGTIHESFDEQAEIYPNGFDHDVTLIKPTFSTAVKDIASPISNLGWLHQDSWSSLRQQTTKVKILADTEGSRSAKTIRCSRPSDVLVVGEGILLNQKAAAGNSNSLKEHDISTWKDLVSRALLYRVYPDFDPPTGYSGLALYANGMREDGTQGPGIVGFQSFVQRSGHVQNFEMEGPALERRLQTGRVAFYGAFGIPAELKKYDIA